MLKKFLRETSGNIMIMSAVAMGPMLMAAAVGIDMAERHRATSAYQAAVDAAALAAAKVLNSSGKAPAQAAADAKSYGEVVFNANIENLQNSSGTIEIDTGNGDCVGQGVVATAQLSHPMFFDGIHGYFTSQGSPDTLKLTVSSEVKCGNDTLEVAMVLDNSGSMRNSKIATLRTAARDLVAKLHTSMAGNPKPDPLMFSLVPFSSMVNVGPQNANASWMDTEGASSVHNEHLGWENDPDATFVGGNRYVDSSGNPLTRFRLYNELGISWAGCVEQRPFPMHTRDTPASAANPDSLFVPAFAPDTPDNFSGETEETPGDNSGPLPIHCKKWKNKWNKRHLCKKWHDTDYSNNTFKGEYHPTEGYANRSDSNLYVYDTGEYIGPGSGGGITFGDTISEENYKNNYIADNHNMPGGSTNMHLHPDNSGTGPGQYSRQKWTWKYFDNPVVRNSVVNDLQGLPGGPNAWCTAIPMTPLTTSKSTIDDGIDAMIASGATNVQQGIAWGWRTLSSASPFTGGRSEAINNNRKIMIVMTDGNNTNYPMDNWENVSTRNPTFYSSFGHNGGEYGATEGGPLTRRLFDGFSIASPSDTKATYTQAMDEHISATCENAKAAGISIYTIAFDVPNGAPIKAVMEACSSTGKSGQPLYYNADNNAELLAAFDSIYNDITELTITK